MSAKFPGGGGGGYDHLADSLIRAFELAVFEWLYDIVSVKRVKSPVNATMTNCNPPTTPRLRTDKRYTYRMHTKTIDKQID